LGDGELELVVIAGELEEALGRAAGDVQEDGVGEGFVGGA
jgi:hypothetical protein